jgi:hypothetical protein
VGSSTVLGKKASHENRDLSHNPCPGLSMHQKYLHRHRFRLKTINIKFLGRYLEQKSDGHTVTNKFGDILLDTEYATRNPDRNLSLVQFPYSAILPVNTPCFTLTSDAANFYICAFPLTLH